MYRKKTQGWGKHADFIVLDVFCLHLAFVLAYMTRHGMGSPYTDRYHLNIATAYTMADLLVLITNNTLKNVLKRGYYKELVQTVKHVWLVTLIIAFYLFSMQDGAVYSRIMIYLMAFYYAGITYGVRLCWKKVLCHRKCVSAGAAMFFITTTERAESVIRQFRRNSMNAYTIQGICILDRDCVNQVIEGVLVTCNKDNVLDHLCSMWVDEVFLSVPVNYPYPEELISSIADMGIVTHVEMEAFHTEKWQHQVIEKIAGTTVRTVSMTLATPRELALKRAMDIAGGIVGCILTGILTLFIGPLIYMQSPGPIFFAQTRVGRNGKKFKLYKFRSMYLDAEERKAELMKGNRIKDGMMFKLDFDPRIIGCKRLPDGSIKKGIGNYIRDWSLDEFPQFFNVLKGDLSLCGTRPPTVDEWEKYDLHHRARLAIKPGITGMWQVSGRSKITDFEEVVKLDKKYIREWSMGLDLRILMRTIKVVLDKDGSM